MGFLTTITIHNDALHAFEKNPQQFAETLFEGINKANRHNTPADMGFSVGNCSYGGYITIHPSRHADASALYLHAGNGVTDLNRWSNDFQRLVRNNPIVAKKYLKHARQQIRAAEAYLKAETLAGRVGK